MGTALAYVRGGNTAEELNRVGGGNTPWPYQNLSQFLVNIVGLTIAIAGVGSFFLLLYGGIRYITSAGDKLGTQHAREVITAAIVGLVIVVGSYAVATTLGKVLGFNPTNITIPAAPRGTGGAAGQAFCKTQANPNQYCVNNRNRKLAVGTCTSHWECRDLGGLGVDGEGCLELPDSPCVWVDDPPGGNPWDCVSNTGSCAGAQPQ